MMKLSDCFIPLLAYVRALEQSPSGSAEEVFQHLNVFIQAAEKNALTAGYSVKQFHAGLFPIAAWADERISRLHHWENKFVWHHHLLQRHHFKTIIAGVEFFQRLDKLDKQEQDVREIYLLCLCMGYLGRYSIDPNVVELSNLRIVQYQLLKDSNALMSASDSPLLFPFAYELNSSIEDEDAPMWKSWFTLKNIGLYAIPPLLIALLMVLLNYQLSDSVDQFYQLISK